MPQAVKIVGIAGSLRRESTTASPYAPAGDSAGGANLDALDLPDLPASIRTARGAAGGSERAEARIGR
jgi:hypothetical protein